MGEKHQSKDADALIVYHSPVRHGAKERPGNTAFFVTEAEASFLEEGPNPKVNVDTRWLVGRWLDMDGGEENTKQRLRSAG